jgi:hypothetical protein
MSFQHIPALGGCWWAEFLKKGSNEGALLQRQRYRHWYDWLFSMEHDHTFVYFLSLRLLAAHGGGVHDNNFTDPYKSFTCACFVPSPQHLT